MTDLSHHNIFSLGSVQYIETVTPAILYCAFIKLGGSQIHKKKKRLKWKQPKWNVDF